MQPLLRKTMFTQDGEKTLSVYACDIRDLNIDVDVMTVSAFYRSYNPTPGTLFEALLSSNIDVRALAYSPLIDLREQCNVWLSREVPDFVGLPIKRIGCIEMSGYSEDRSSCRASEARMLVSIQAYFKMLDIASITGISIERIVLPVLGTGQQQISAGFIMTPMLNECMQFLKSNHSVRHIMIVTRNQEIAFRFGMLLENSFSFRNEAAMTLVKASEGKDRQMGFVSYSSKDRYIADSLCVKLEARGIQVWYAPRNITSGDYASAIVKAISSCTMFILILSKNSLRSDHVLNEIDLAFSQLQRGVRFLPLKIDESEIRPSFLYYLSRQHWMDAHLPPLEKRLEEFADLVVNDSCSTGTGPAAQ